MVYIYIIASPDSLYYRLYLNYAKKKTGVRSLFFGMETMSPTPFFAAENYESDPLFGGGSDSWIFLRQ